MSTPAKATPATVKKAAASRTRKTPATKKDKAPEPMDPDATEATPVVGDDGKVDVQPHAPFSKRNCWSVEVLLAEVKALYPEATYYASEATPRGVIVGVTFENWEAHDENDPGLALLLSCIEGDERVAEVTSSPSDDQGDNSWVSVRLIANPVTMDSREEFGLASAYSIMVRA